MLVSYYNNPELAYATRNRYHNFNYIPFYEEEQRSVLLGDGATTSIKTNKDNICNYVEIDNTRWFVTSYTYLNGGQVQLNLQRDVIGEMGIQDCFGKIERGYTNSILKNRKELSLNQILKKRQHLKPNSNIYGNYYLKPLADQNEDIHKNELWGIIYMVKPTEGQVNINIPSFAPETVNYSFIENGTTKNISYNQTAYYYFTVKVSPTNRYYFIRLNMRIIPGRLTSYESINIEYLNGESENAIIVTYNDSAYITIQEEISRLAELFGQIDWNLRRDYNVFNAPEIPILDTNIPDYNNVTILRNNNYYSYKMNNNNDWRYGSIAPDRDLFNAMNAVVNGALSYQGNIDTLFDKELFLVVNQIVYNYTILDASASGTIVIDVSKQQLIDEPYYILAFPLFNTTIVEQSTGKEYVINRDVAFNVFNTTIETLSGDNAYLIDAQIYPYCPILTGINTELNGYPFFNINSTFYIHDCKIQLLPNSDIKKEYIQRVYSIISPEQSSKFDFNFYDYINRIEDTNGINYAEITIKIKTALKPYAIISSAVIQADDDSLIGIKYASDLRGAQPTSNGFECSLSSNAFETYKRQNSNYQQIFSLEKEELQKQHSVEFVNETTSMIVNTTTAGIMGAIAGGTAAGSGFLSNVTAPVAAGVGAVASAGIVGGTMGWQMYENNKLREYEESLQQQRFDLSIGTVKNIPNSINRISSFNEIILQDFWYTVETYECSEYEKTIVDKFITRYGYGIGVFDYAVNYQRNGWFLRSTLISSSYPVNLHQIAEKELKGGIYYYEQN